MPLTTTVEGLQRYTINLRYDRDFRSDLDSLKRDIVIPTPTGAQIPLGELADIKVVDGPMDIKTEGAVPNDWVYVDIHDIDVGTYVQNAMHAVNAAIAAGQIKLPPGYNIFWSGQYEYMLRAKQRLLMVVPLTLLIITLIIYLNTRSLLKTAIVLLAVPFSLVGAFWTLYLLHYNLSVAVWVGIIALAGLDAETGVIMLLYLDLAYDEWKQKGLMRNLARFARRDLSRRGETAAPENHDRVRHHRRPRADFVEPRHRRGRDETHRRADGRRRDHLHHHACWWFIRRSITCGAHAAWPTLHLSPLPIRSEPVLWPFACRPASPTNSQRSRRNFQWHSQADVVRGGADEQFIVAGFDDVSLLLRVPITESFHRNVHGDAGGCALRQMNSHKTAQSQIRPAARQN